jgi:hypothetical protein
MIKDLFRKYLLEYMVDEAVPMTHFKERVNEVLYDIQSIQIPDTYYLPNIPKETQDAWIIKQIQEGIQPKINDIIAKDYPVGGSCVLAPLGMVKVQPIKGNPVNVLITAQKKEGLTSGISYYVTIYDNRLPTLVLADPKIASNSSAGGQLQAHIKNTIAGGYRYTREKSFVDSAFAGNIVIKMSDFKA